MALDVNDADFVVQRIGRQYKEKPPVFNDNLQTDEIFAIQRNGTLYQELHYADEWYNHIGDDSYIARYHIANIRETFTISDNNAWFDVYLVATESKIVSGVTTFEFEAGREYIVLSYDKTESGSKKQLLRFRSPCNFDFGVATNTKRVTNFQNFLSGNDKFDGDVQYLVVSENCVDIKGMFQNCNAFTGHNFYKTHWNTSNIGSNGMSYLFENCWVLSIDLTDWCVTNIQGEPFMFATSSSILEEVKPCWGRCPYGEDGEVNPCDRGWTKHDGPCFHIINTGTETINLNSSRRLVGYDPDTEENLGPVTSIAPGVEIIFTAPVDCTYLFADNTYAEWDFGDETNLRFCTSMVRMFEGCTAFNGKMDGTWDVSEVDNMEGTFHKCNSFNKDLDDWDVSNVLNMHEMFADAYDFDGDIANWDVKKVTNMNRMFTDAQHFSQDISGWDVKKCFDMEYMFSRTRHFNTLIDEWKTANVVDMVSMFEDAVGFNKDLSKWCVEDITTKPDNFDKGAVNWTGGALTRPQWGAEAPCNGDKPWRGQGKVVWHIIDQSRVMRVAIPCDMWRAQDGVYLGKTTIIPDTFPVVVVSNPYESGLFNAQITLNGGANWSFGPETDISPCKNFSRMFYQCQSLQLTVMDGNWDTSNVEQFMASFDTCGTANGHDGIKNRVIENFDTSSCWNMDAMFKLCDWIDDTWDLRHWCVSGVKSEPSDFNRGGSLPKSNYPVWGTCP